MFKLHPKKRLLSGLITALLLVLLTPNWVDASPDQVSHRTQLRRDLDGDRIPETVTIRQSGLIYRISIHFTSGRPKLHLTVYQSENEAGLTIQTSDVDNDRDLDVVVTSATSIRPVAVWLNRGKAKFQKASTWAYGGLGRYTGPTLHRRAVYQPDPALGSTTEPLAYTVKATQCLEIRLDVEDLGLWDSEQVPADSVPLEVPTRGPPLHISI
jgi:hypothetical protein